MKKWFILNTEGIKSNDYYMIKTHSLKKKHKRKTFKKKAFKKGGSISLKNVHLPKMSCSPNPNKQKLSNSCFTKDIVENLVQVFNSTSFTKINTNNTIENQLTELKTNFLNKCGKDDTEVCLIEKMKPGWTNQLFMPKRKWEKKNEWLSNNDIDRVMSVYEKAYPTFKYCSTLTIDFADTKFLSKKTLSKFFCQHSSASTCQYKMNNDQLKGYDNWGVIFNLDKFEQSGSHWVSLHVDFRTNPPCAFYFDSAVTYSNIPKSIQKLIDTLKKSTPTLKVIRNTKQHQHSNTECGVYSLFFIITMLTQKIPFIQKTMSTEEIRDLFLKGDIPDSFIEQYRQIFFTVGNSKTKNKIIKKN